MKKIIWIVFLVLCLTSHGWAASTYYVDFNAANDSGAGSQADPWKRAPGMSGWNGSATLSSGDTVILKGGVTWTFASTTTSLWVLPTVITIRGGQQLSPAWGSGLPILDGTGSTAARYGIDTGNRDGLVIDGIKIYNTEHPTGGSGIYLGVTPNLEIKNSTFDFCGDQTIVGGDNSSNILIHDNAFSNTGRLFLGVSDGNVTDNVQIYNNTFLGPGAWVGGTAGSRCTAAGVPNTCCVGASDTEEQRAANATACRTTAAASCTGAGTVASCCTAANDTNARIIANAAACAVHGDGIMIGSGCVAANTCLTDVLIHHNTFKGDWAQGVTALIFLNNGGAGGGASYGGNGALIYDNQIALDTDGSSSPAFIWIWSLWNNVQIYNNTFGGYQGGTYPTSYCISPSHNMTNLVVKNNIFSGCKYAIGLQADQGASLTADYNLYDSGAVLKLITVGGTDYNTLAAAQGAGYEANGVSADPKFVTAPTGSNSGNWQLQSDSPAVGVGLDLSATFTTDLLGASRPTGASTWDIGAYEYGAEGGGDVTAPTILTGAPNTFIGTNGTTVTVKFSETVVTTGFDDGDFNLDCATAGANIALNTIAGTGDTRTFTAASVIGVGDTCNLDYTGGANEIEDAAGNDLAAVNDVAVTNNSTQNPPDATAPVITGFEVQTTVNSLTNVPILTFTCTDTVGLHATPYCVTTVNSSVGCEWAASPPSTVTLTSAGRTAYGWCRDAADTPNVGSANHSVILLRGSITIGSGAGAGSISF